MSECDCIKGYTGFVLKKEVVVCGKCGKTAVEAALQADYREGFDHGFIEGGRNALKALSDYISKETPPIIIKTGENKIGFLQSKLDKAVEALECVVQCEEGVGNTTWDAVFDNAKKVLTDIKQGEDGND